MKNKLAELTSQQLVKRLKREKSIDYVALVNSSWHFLSALSTIEWLKAKKGVEKGIILLFEHPTDGYIVEKDLVHVKWFDDMEVYGFKFGALATTKEVNRYLLNHRKEGKPFYILRPVMPKLEFSVMLYNEGIRKNIVHVDIEEGLATYMRDWKGWLFEEIHTYNVVEIWKQLGMRTWRKQFSEVALRKRNELIENTIFLPKRGGLIKNKRAIYYFRQTLNKMRTIYNLSEYENYQGSIIICTQTYGEQKRITAGEDIKTIRRICGILQKRGYRVIIKPHPRERDLEKYAELGCEVDSRNDIPLESILAGLKEKPKGIVGITTTTLITASLFWGITTLSIARLIKRECYKEEIVGEINKFCELFKDIVQIPERYEQIKI